MTSAEAFRVCRGIARREAKNFYYAFRVLPPAKRDAMCAVYAFMRRADDLADDESLTLPERRANMSIWLESWRATRRGTDSSREPHAQDPVFLALAATQQRFQISDELLEQLVQGTTMDLEGVKPGVSTVTTPTIAEPGAAQRTLQAYDTFADLYRYCYLVASVVGLVCIKIFGYTDPRAEALAEKTGIAFQLTNILRDVKEDAERNRLYLPLEDLESHGLSLDLFEMSDQRIMRKERLKAVLQFEATRALTFYQSAEELLPLIDADSRAALWVMVSIYRCLLGRIIAADYDVFSKRIAVPTSTKLSILARGAVMAAGKRLLQ